MKPLASKPVSKHLSSIVHELARDRCLAFVTISEGTRPNIKFYAELSGELYLIDRHPMINIQNPKSGKMSFRLEDVNLAEKSSLHGWRINVHIK